MLLLSCVRTVVILLLPLPEGTFRSDVTMRSFTRDHAEVLNVDDRL